MKTVVILTERLTQSSLSAVVPAEGVASVRVARHLSAGREAFAPESYRSYRNPQRFTPAVRIELLVEDDAVATVFEAVSVAYGAGFVNDAEMWIESPALGLSA